MTLKSGITVIIAPRLYVNYACDIFTPRGFWNIVSFADFTDRITKKGLVHLAVDVDGSFWKENAKDYCGHGTWVLNRVQELMLYETTREKFWKESDYLDKFRRKYKGGPKLLEMVDLESERSQNVKDVETYILKTFDKIEGKEEKPVEEDEEATASTKYPRYLDDCPKTEPEELRRPNITAKRLVTKSIYGDDED
jgi:hypothetical protein